MKTIFAFLLMIMPLMPVFAQNDEVIFGDPERMPEYPGGQKALFAFLGENTHYPKESEKNKEEGRAIVKFIIDKDGTVTDVEIARSSGYELLDKEAVRVVSSMPKWKPGSISGEFVRVQFTLPVNFRLNTPAPKAE